MTSANQMIPSAVAKTLLKADVNNLAKKVKEGKPLSRGERQMLTAAIDVTPEQSDAPDPYVKNQTDLAKALKVERKTIQRWLKANPELKESPYRWSNGHYKVEAWREWKKEKAGIRSDDDLSSGQLKARQILLQNEKLEVQIGVLRQEYQKTSDVERWAAEMVTAACKVLDSIPATIAPQVVGLTVPDAEIRLQEAIDEAREFLFTSPWK